MQFFIDWALEISLVLLVVFLAWGAVQFCKSVEEYDKWH